MSAQERYPWRKAISMPFLCHQATYDKDLKKHWLTGWRNARSLSKTVQEVIRITGEYIRSKVTQPIQKENAFFSIIGDEVTDRDANQEVLLCHRKHVVCAGKKNSTNGIVHLLQQSLFKSQCCSRAQVNSSHWNMIRTLRETFSVFHISPKRQRFLERVLGKCGSISRKEKLKDLGKTRWAERHGYYIIGCTLSESSAAAECLRLIWQSYDEKN